MQTKYNTTLEIPINETNYAIDVTVTQEDPKLTAVTILFREPLETQYFTVARDTALVTILDLATELATDVIIQSLTIDLPVSEFKKFDSGKCMVSLVDPEFTLGVGQILTFGAKKYAPNNWKLATDLTRIKDAAYRH